MGSDIIVLIILLILSGIFSSSEIALISITPSKVRELIEKKVPNAKYLHKLKKNQQKLIFTILIGNNVVNILASVYATFFFTKLFGSQQIGIITGVMTFLILVFP